MGTVLKTCADCGKLKKIGASKSRCKSCRKIDPTKFEKRPFGSGPKKPGMERSTIKPFEGWRVGNLPKCVVSSNDYSEIGLSKRQFLFVLRAYGFASYAEYLQSNTWQTVRQQVLVNTTCHCGCGQTANQVHHKRYTEANLVGASTKGMIAICAGCHHAIEFVEDRKAKLHEANSQLRERQNENVAGLDVPTDQELRDYLSGNHKKLSVERKLLIRKHLHEKAAKA